MTREEFEKSDARQDAQFIGENRAYTSTEYNAKEKKIYSTVNGGKGKIKSFEIDEYLWLYGAYVAIKASDIKPELKQMEFLVEARSAVVHLIEHCKRISQGKEVKKYKYGGFIRSIDSHVLMSKAELENKLLESQITTNQSVIETNINIRETNENIKDTNTNTVTTNKTTKNLLKWTTIFAILATLVSAASFFVSFLDYRRELNKDLFQHQYDRKDSIIQVFQSENSRLKSENAVIIIKLDSLKKKY
jgi:hypothetical protein